MRPLARARASRSRHPGSASSASLAGSRSASRSGSADAGLCNLPDPSGCSRKVLERANRIIERPVVQSVVVASLDQVGQRFETGLQEGEVVG